MTSRAMDDSDVKSPSIQGGAGPAGGGRAELKRVVQGQLPPTGAVAWTSVSGGPGHPSGPGHQSPAKPGPS